METKPQSTEKAVFAAGCFWGVEETFRQIPGVVNTQVGYTGGDTPNPHYNEVCGGNTRHAEALEIEFDPKLVPYERLLEVFWNAHDPTTLNRQGPDVGTQYRSAVFYHGEAQQAAAQASKEKQHASGKFRRPIVTEIRPASQFFRAEEYHQQYLLKRGLPGCHI